MPFAARIRRVGDVHGHHRGDVPPRGRLRDLDGESLSPGACRCRCGCGGCYRHCFALLALMNVRRGCPASGRGVTSVQPRLRAARADRQRVH